MCHIFGNQSLVCLVALYVVGLTVSLFAGLRSVVALSMSRNCLESRFFQPELEPSRKESRQIFSAGSAYDVIQHIPHRIGKFLVIRICLRSRKFKYRNRLWDQFGSTPSDHEQSELVSPWFCRTRPVNEVAHSSLSQNYSWMAVMVSRFGQFESPGGLSSPSTVKDMRVQVKDNRYIAVNIVYQADNQVHTEDTWVHFEDI